MEENQRKLYNHFKKLSVEGKTDAQREKCAGYAAEILKSFPQFEKKVEKSVEVKVEVKSNSKEK